MSDKLDNGKYKHWKSKAFRHSMWLARLRLVSFIKWPVLKAKSYTVLWACRELHKQGCKGEELSLKSSENNSNQINALRRGWMFSSSAVFLTMGENQENDISFHGCFPHHNKTLILSRAFRNIRLFIEKIRIFYYSPYFPQPLFLSLFSSFKQKLIIDCCSEKSHKREKVKLLCPHEKL